MKFSIFLCFDLQLHIIYYSNIIVDADLTVKQAIMLHRAYMHRVGLSLQKKCIIEAT